MEPVGLLNVGKEPLGWASGDKAKKPRALSWGEWGAASHNRLEQCRGLTPSESVSLVKVPRGTWTPNLSRLAGKSG